MSVIMISTQDGHPILLRERCGACQGEGVEADYRTRKFEHCQPCDGKGFVLTAAGAAIVRLVRENGGLA